jgi:2-polyprenyl-3-methyl-5-hydroxy-6-metoxy-1,4-benzoquinol methylase
MRHCGKAYHEFILGSPRDRRVRERFQQMVFRLMPPHATILDFGAGTGIDARCYAAKGFTVLVHEPSEANLGYLREYCRQEIAKGKIVITDLSVTRKVEMIVANFAVLNLIGDHRALFAKFAGLLVPRGFVLVSLLNPFFLGDARYAWWRGSLRSLVANGAYAVDGEFDRIYRFAPSVVSRAARPDFTVLTCVPAWPRLAISRYIFMLFQKL